MEIYEKKASDKYYKTKRIKQINLLILYFLCCTMDSECGIIMIISSLPVCFLCVLSVRFTVTRSSICGGITRAHTNIHGSAAVTQDGDSSQLICWQGPRQGPRREARGHGRAEGHRRRLTPRLIYSLTLARVSGDTYCWDSKERCVILRNQDRCDVTYWGCKIHYKRCIS